MLRGPEAGSCRPPRLQAGSSWFVGKCIPECHAAVRTVLRGRGRGESPQSIANAASDFAPDARSVVLELDEADGLDGAGVPGGEFIAEELIVQVIPQAADEFTCYSCFLVRHRSQIARQKGTHAYCTDCEG
jgi:hypothetical protein